MKKSLTENLISNRWKKCALLKESYDRDGIRTHARRPYYSASHKVEISEHFKSHRLEFKGQRSNLKHVEKTDE